MTRPTMVPLPRSIRWKIQLGILSCPISDDWTMEELHGDNEDTILEQRNAFQQLCDRHQDDLFHNLHPRRASIIAVDPTLDPLSQLVKQHDHENAKWDAEQRKERTRRANIGCGKPIEAIPSAEILKVVAKDLNRLNDEHSNYTYSRLNWEHHRQDPDNVLGTEPTFKDALNQRKEHLTLLLHIYAKENANQGGYQQGMHEVCSYVMMVVEMDNFDSETSDQDCYGELLSSEHILMDTYLIFTKILGMMTLCYHGDLEAMAQMVRSKLFYVAPSEATDLYMALDEMPLELYCARWLRLLFAREVQGLKLVLDLWDVFMNLISAHKWELMVVLEMMAASRIWMDREMLLQAESVEEGFQKLLQTDAMDDIKPLASILLTGLQQLARGTLHCVEKEIWSDTHRQVMRRSKWITKIGIGTSPEEVTNTFRDLSLVPQSSIQRPQQPGFGTTPVAELRDSSSSSAHQPPQQHSSMSGTCGYDRTLEAHDNTTISSGAYQQTRQRSSLSATIGFVAAISEEQHALVSLNVHQRPQRSSSFSAATGTTLVEETFRQYDAIPSPSFLIRSTTSGSPDDYAVEGHGARNTLTSWMGYAEPECGPQGKTSKAIVFRPLRQFFNDNLYKYTQGDHHLGDYKKGEDSDGLLVDFGRNDKSSSPVLDDQPPVPAQGFAADMRFSRLIDSSSMHYRGMIC